MDIFVQNHVSICWNAVEESLVVRKADLVTGWGKHATRGYASRDVLRGTFGLTRWLPRCHSSLPQN